MIRLLFCFALGVFVSSALAAERVPSPPVKWKASGAIRCSFNSPALDQQCDFKVVRDLPRQTAEVWIFPGRAGAPQYRYLHYRNRGFASPNAVVLIERVDDAWRVSLDDGKERYVIPDALVEGG
jgi:hypothetical protein